MAVSECQSVIPARVQLWLLLPLPFPLLESLQKPSGAQQDEFACLPAVVFEKQDPNYFPLGE